jgi:hypothetical protein
MCEDYDVDGPIGRAWYEVESARSWHIEDYVNAVHHKNHCTSSQKWTYTFSREAGY